MKNFLRYGIPFLTVVLIALCAYFIFRPDTTVSNANSQGCNIKNNPDTKKFDQYPSMCLDKKKKYSAVINTQDGEINAALFSDNAPKTVNSFVFLSKSGFYNGITFHRIVPGFVIQAGDPTSFSGIDNPGYSFEDEINPDKLGLTPDSIKSNESRGYVYNRNFNTVKILKGTLAMANKGPNTNGSQFFIALADEPNLDGQYTPFGIVTGGMDVVNKIASVKTDSNSKPIQDIKIEKIDIKTN